uniref:Uncharacterized protein n=1 Tax=Arundo donax TaxID=35708 RepID=A0A0A9GZF6_ARUDO
MQISTPLSLSLHLPIGQKPDRPIHRPLPPAGVPEPSNRHGAAAAPSAGAAGRARRGGPPPLPARRPRAPPPRRPRLQALVPPHLRRRLPPQVLGAPPHAAHAGILLQRRVIFQVHSHLHPVPAPCRRPPPTRDRRPPRPRPLPQCGLATVAKSLGECLRPLGPNHGRAEGAALASGGPEPLQLERRGALRRQRERRLRPHRLPQQTLPRCPRDHRQNGDVCLCLLVGGWCVERANHCTAPVFRS